MSSLKLALVAVVVVAVLVPAGIAAAGPASGERPSADAAGKSKKKRKQIRKATRAIRNGNYVGTRGDGEPVDYTYCKNKKFRANTGGAVATGKKWKVKSVRFTKKGFKAVIKGSGGFSTSIARLKGQWKIGYTLFDEPAELGNVERSNAKQECKTL